MLPSVSSRPGLSWPRGPYRSSFMGSFHAGGRDRAARLRSPGKPISVLCATSGADGEARVALRVGVAHAQVLEDREHRVAGCARHVVQQRAMVVEPPAPDLVADVLE